jgi:3-hydroxybutyryl-CoA dehydratase
MQLEEIEVGQAAEFTKTVTETDVVLFAGITGDFNPAHVNAVEAEQGMFGGRIAHGLLSAGFISTVLAMKLPGPGTIYMSQNLRFLCPVRIGDTVTARVEVAEIIPEKRRVRLSTIVSNHHGEMVIDGEAMVMLPEPRASPVAHPHAEAHPAPAGAAAP